ncbi:hypothetical protein HPP92_026374 [Vanilla planifolia]|uniref:Uncharacterized protein n=1 Tax=Vanilla planifolia TaxID=51239 RepID=A0A835PJ32_VANPL|nr:hypothetical protein HPP92_026374 [Vanilla planifolia]
MKNLHILIWQMVDGRPRQVWITKGSMTSCMDVNPDEHDEEDLLEMSKGRFSESKKVRLYLTSGP